MSKFKVGDMAKMPGWDKFYRVAKVTGDRAWLETHPFSGKSYPYNATEMVKETYSSCAAAEVDNLADEYGGGKLKIVAGRYYKTRDGRKVGPMIEWSSLAEHSWEADDEDDSGLYRPDGTSEYGGDLISEWQDEPKFKVGDAIRHKSLGYEGTVLKVVSDTTVETHWTKKNWGAIDPIDSLELISPTTMADIVRKHSGTAVVMLIENGQPKPATRPYVHADRASAATEAERLATTMPGSEFGVYELVTRRVADVVVREAA